VPCRRLAQPFAFFNDRLRDLVVFLAVIVTPTAADELRWLQLKHKPGVARAGPIHSRILYGHFGLVRLSRLGHDVPWVKA
jgi:hypothetical protein